MKSKSQLPSPIIAFIPIIALMIIIYFTIHMYGPDALTGAIQVALFSTTICCLVGIFLILLQPISIFPLSLQPVHLKILIVEKDMKAGC